jgi:hypothetical protein
LHKKNVSNKINEIFSTSDKHFGENCFLPNLHSLEILILIH